MELVHWLLVAVGLLVPITIVLVVLLVRASQRLLAFDELFQLLADDVETNLKHFNRMNHMTIMSGEPEVVESHKNMMIMGKRLNEFIKRMEELTGLNMRKPPPGPPPDVI
jgi:hypothetical protein